MIDEVLKDIAKNEDTDADIGKHKCAAYDEDTDDEVGYH